MPSYVSRPVEVEAVQWSGAGTGYLAAQEIVRWVNANGGEARYEPAQYTTDPTACGDDHLDARIAVRTVNGWAYATPGDYIVRGYQERLVRYPLHGGGSYWAEARAFYPMDPETFENRWTLKEQTT